jgi:hypothetical protein
LSHFAEIQHTMKYTKGIRRIFLEPYCNMNTSNGRYFQNSMNQGCRTCGDSRNRVNSNNSERPCADRQRRMMRDNAGRGMEVECVCKAVPKKNCHQDDPMEKLGDRFPVVMAYVPWQQWGELYDADCGLMQGTIFKELNLIFCGVRC